MDRRKSLKAMVAGTVTSGFMFTNCVTDTEEKASQSVKEATKSDDNYDKTRTIDELKREEALREKEYFTEHELETLTVLADIIIPAEGQSHAASEVGVIDF